MDSDIQSDTQESPQGPVTAAMLTREMADAVRNLHDAINAHYGQALSRFHFVQRLAEVPAFHWDKDVVQKFRKDLEHLNQEKAEIDRVFNSGWDLMVDDSPDAWGLPTATKAELLPEPDVVRLSQWVWNHRLRNGEWPDIVAVGWYDDSLRSEAALLWPNLIDLEVLGNPLEIRLEHRSATPLDNGIKPRESYVYF